MFYEKSVGSPPPCPSPSSRCAPGCWEGLRLMLHRPARRPRVHLSGEMGLREREVAAARRPPPQPRTLRRRCGRGAQCHDPRFWGAMEGERRREWWARGGAGIQGDTQPWRGSSFVLLAMAKNWLAHDVSTAASNRTRITDPNMFSSAVQLTHVAMFSSNVQHKSVGRYCKVQTHGS